MSGYAETRWAIKYLTGRAQKRPAEVEDGRIIFRVAYVRQIRLLCLCIFGGLAVQSQYSGDPWWVTSLLTAFAIASLLCRSADVVLDGDGLIGPNAWGSKVRVTWQEVASIEYNAESQHYQVGTISGSKIMFSPFHADPGRFEVELKKRTRLKIKVSTPGVWRPDISWR